MSTRLAWQDRAALGLVALSFALSVALYPRLPARIPIHFDLAGNANGWGPRALGAFLAPAIALAAWLLVRFVARPRGGGLSTAAAVRTAALLTVAVLCVVHGLTLRAALGAPFAVGVLTAVLGGLWIGLGLVMPRLRRNHFLGVRTPASLSSDEAWARTHRLAGATFVLGGLTALVLSAVSEPAAIVALVAAALVPAALSFPLARTRP